MSALLSNKTFILLILSFFAGYLSYRILAFIPLILTLWLLFDIKRNPDGYIISWHKTYLLFVTGFLFLGGISLFWAEFFDLSSERLWKAGIVLAGGIIPLSAQPKEPEAHSGLLKGILAAWFITAGIFILDHLVPNTLVYGLFHTHEFLPAQINRFAIVLLIGLAFMWFTDLVSYQVKIIALAVFIGVLSVTESQSVQLTFLLLCGLFALWPILKIWAVYLFGVGVSLVTLGFPWLAQLMFALRPEDPGTFGTKAAAMMRLEIWDAIANKIMIAPFWGFGLENIRESELDMTHIYWPNESVLHPHNYALQLWVELGLLGVIAFLGLVWVALLKIGTKFSLPQQKCALALIVTIWGINLSAYGIWQGWWLGLTVLTIISFYTLTKRQKPV